RTLEGCGTQQLINLTQPLKLRRFCGILIEACVQFLQALSAGRTIQCFLHESSLSFVRHHAFSSKGVIAPEAAAGFSLSASTCRARNRRLLIALSVVSSMSAISE